MKHEIGDIVFVRKDLTPWRIYDTLGVNETVANARGKFFKIYAIRNGYYELTGLHDGTGFNDRMLAKPKQGEKI